MRQPLSCGHYEAHLVEDPICGACLERARQYETREQRAVRIAVQVPGIFMEAKRRRA